MRISKAATTKPSPASGVSAGLPRAGRADAAQPGTGRARPRVQPPARELVTARQHQERDHMFPRCWDETFSYHRCASGAVKTCLTFCWFVATPPARLA
jgi:hypothetical protein